MLGGGLLLGPGCANGSSDQAGLLGQVSLEIQGTRPAGAAASQKRATTTNPAEIEIRDADGSLQGVISLETALLSLKEIKFKSSEEEDGAAETQSEEDEIAYEGPVMVDLLTNMVTPSLEEIQLAEKTYDSIELKLAKLEGEEEDDSGEPLVDETHPLFGKSVYLSGTYTPDKSTAIPFEMSYELDEEFKLSGGEGSLSIDESAEINPIIIAFRMARWFVFDNPETNSDSISFSDATTVNGELVFTKDIEDPNQKIMEIIKENIKESADYGEDRDGDGELGSDEDDDPDEEDEEDE